MIIPALMSTALSTAGALYNHKIEQAAIDETNRQNRLAMQMEGAARNAESQRQRAWEKSQFASVQEAAEASDPAALTKEIEIEATAPDNEFITAADNYNTAQLAGQQSSGEIASAIGKTVGEALAQTKDLLRAKSMLTSQESGFAGMRDAALGMRDDVSNVGSKRNRSYGVAQLESTIPTADVTKSDSPLGDLLMMAGKAVGGLGGGIFGAGGGTPTLGLLPKGTPGIGIW